MQRVTVPGVEVLSAGSIPAEKSFTQGAGTQAGDPDLHPDDQAIPTAREIIGAGKVLQALEGNPGVEGLPFEALTGRDRVARFVTNWPGLSGCLEMGKMTVSQASRRFFPTFPLSR